MTRLLTDDSVFGVGERTSIRARRYAPRAGCLARVGTARLVRSGLKPPAVSAVPASSLRSAFGAARPGSGGGRGVKRSDG
jgi:hypothetical protein